MNKILIALTIITIFAACQRKQNQNMQEPTLPKALQEKGSYSIVTKRGYDNVVEDLYDELVKNTPELKNIETEIQTITDNRNDSTKNFNFYNDKNEGYYVQANNTISNIKDSLLKEKVKNLIAASNSKYKNRIDAHTKLIESINTKMMSLADLHTFLKIKTTIAVMEKYQADNLPSVKQIDSYLQQINNTANKIDSFTKK